MSGGTGVLDLEAVWDVLAELASFCFLLVSSTLELQFMEGLFTVYVCMYINGSSHKQDDLSSKVSILSLEVY